MGQKPGTKPTPTATLRLHGTFRDDRRCASEPEPEVVIPDRPKHLRGEAKKEWDRLAPELEKKRCLTNWDRSFLAAYCIQHARAIDIQRKLGKLKGVDRYITETTNGNATLNLLLSAQNKAFLMMHKFGVEFGLSPASRTRIDIQSDKGELDAFAKLNQRGRKKKVS